MDSRPVISKRQAEVYWKRHRIDVARSAQLRKLLDAQRGKKQPEEVSGELRKLMDKLLEGSKGDYFDRAAARGFCEAYCNFSERARVEALKKLTENHIDADRLKIAAMQLVDELNEQQFGDPGSGSDELPEVSISLWPYGAHGAAASRWCSTQHRPLASVIFSR